MMPPGSSFADAERTSRAPCRVGASQGGFGPPVPPFGLACPQRSRRARRATSRHDRGLIFRDALRRACRRAMQPNLEAADAGTSPATAAARDHRGKRQTLPTRRGRRKRARPRVVPCARDLRVWGSGTGRCVGFGRGQALAQRWRCRNRSGSIHGRALTIRGTRRPQKFRGANCAARTPCIFYGRDVAGRADHEQLSGLLPVQPRISRHRLNACTGSMRADANDDPHSDAVSPSHRRQPHHPQSAPPRAAAWPRRRLFPFSQHKCA